MKIILLAPPRGYLTNPIAQPPLGLLYLSSILDSRNIENEVVDLAAGSKIPEDGDIYGFSLTTSDLGEVLPIAKMLKGMGKTIIAGGPHPSTSGDMECFDAIVMGEGERAIIEVISDYPNLRQVYSFPLIEDLDSIPFPDRGKVSHDYTDSTFGGVKSTGLITSRGCPYLCAFCASKKIWGGSVRFRSPGNVCQEILEVRDELGIFAFRIHDDQFTIRRREDLLELLDFFTATDIVWRASARVDRVDPELLQKMKEAGCKLLSFGVESGDQKVLDVLRKNISVEHSKDALRWSREAGIDTRVLLMVGMPGETKDTTDRTIQLLEETNDYWTSIALTEFLPLYGTPIMDNPEKFGVKVKMIDTREGWTLYNSEGLREFSNPLEIEGLSFDDMVQSKVRLRDYILQTKKENRG